MCSEVLNFTFVDKRFFLFWECGSIVSKMDTLNDLWTQTFSCISIDFTIINLGCGLSNWTLPVEATHVSLRPSVQTCSGESHPLLLNEYQPGPEAGHAPPSTVKVKKEWSYTAILPYTILTQTRTTLYLPLENKISRPYIEQCWRHTSKILGLLPIGNWKNCESEIICN
jgi:hypothetical protein